MLLPLVFRDIIEHFADVDGKYLTQKEYLTVTLHIVLTQHLDFVCRVRNDEYHSTTKPRAGTNICSWESYPHLLRLNQALINHALEAGGCMILINNSYLFDHNLNMIEMMRDVVLKTWAKRTAD